MADIDFTTGEYVGMGVYDGVGDRLGTVGAVDEDANELLVVPNPGMIEEGWVDVGEAETVTADPNWIATPDATVHETASSPTSGDRDPASGETGRTSEEPPSAEEWPYTVTGEVVDEIDDEGIHLRF